MLVKRTLFKKKIGKRNNEIIKIAFYFQRCVPFSNCNSIKIIKRFNEISKSVTSFKTHFPCRVQEKMIKNSLLLWTLHWMHFLLVKHTCVCISSNTPHSLKLNHTLGFRVSLMPHMLIIHSFVDWTLTGCLSRSVSLMNLLNHVCSVKRRVAQ